MELNRNQYFLFGLVILFLGIQFRRVDSFVLNERATQFVSQNLQRLKPALASTSDKATLLASQPPLAKHHIDPPAWLGWSLTSLGSVLILYSLALKKPGG